MRKDHVLPTLRELRAGPWTWPTRVTALRWGLVNRVVPAGTAREVALELAAQLAEVPASGLAAVKSGLNRDVVARLRETRGQRSRASSPSR